MAHKVKLTVTCDPDVLVQLDEFRGPVPRSTMVNLILKDVTRPEEN